MKIQHTSLAIVWGLATGLLVGCREDAISHYQAPKLESARVPLPGDGSMVRMLASIFPQKESTWFFKMSGAPAVIGQYQEEFDQFIQSVRFPGLGGQPVAWTVPDNWRHEPGQGLRYATFRLGPKDASLELSVIRLDGAAGSVLDNVNRWRGQIGLKPVHEADLGTVTKELKVNGFPALRVDMTGPGGGKSGMPPFANAPAVPKERGEKVAARPGLKYQTPAGWIEQPNVGGFRVAAFRIADGDKFAEATVIPLEGQAGGLLANVNRWRNQIGLDPVSQERLRQDLRQIDVAGSAVPYIDLLGPASATRQRVLAVAVEQGGKTWFFKMTGPAELVAREKTAFEAFVKSVRFDGGRGGSNG